MIEAFGFVGSSSVVALAIDAGGASGCRIGLERSAANQDRRLPVAIRIFLGQVF